MEVQTRIGVLDLNAQGLPTEATVAKLFDEFDFQRAAQAYLWALPITAFAQWQEQHEQVFGARDGDIVTYTSSRDKIGLLTANATTPYIIGFCDLSRTGPLVIDFPAGQTSGGLADFWQRSLTDFGETGPDKGRGGKYLVLGPDQAEPEGDDGYYLVQSPTFNVFHAFRILSPDPAEGERILGAYQVYPFSQRAAPHKTRIVPAAGRPWSGTQPRGMDYWTLLNGVLQKEPVQERDRYFMAMLRPLGIDKGQPFAPDGRQTTLLAQGAVIGEHMAIANSFEKRFLGAQYSPGSHWDRVLNVAPSQEARYYSQLDERSAWFYEAVTLSQGMASNTPGLGQAYLGCYRDTAGDWLDGGRDYHFRVAPDAPAKLFWSVSAYDIETRCFVDTPLNRVDRGSRDDLIENADGSVDLYFGPQAPAGKPESNWIPTVSGRGWFAYLRLYGPLESYFDRSWPLADIVPTD